MTYWLVGVFRAARLLLAPLRTSLGIVLLVILYLRNYALVDNAYIIYVIMHSFFIYVITLSQTYQKNELDRIG